MALKQKGTDPAAAADPKKRRRVGFSGIDAGVEANECMKVFLVRNPDEVGSVDSTSIQPFDLNHFFGEDGKIYGYKNLKINVWISEISFHGYAEISFEETSDGGKGITDLKPVLQNIFGENLVEKEEFLQTFSKECQYISNVVINGNVIKHDGSNESDPAVEIVQVELQGAAAFLYSRLVPLVLLLVEGSTPIDIGEHGWEMLLVVKKPTQESSVSKFQLLGFAAVHNFYRYPESTRLRVSQILVLPPYQGEGHGLCLLEAINSIAQSENIYDVTIEDPSDYLQYVRSSIDCLRLLTFDPIKSVLCATVSSLKETNLSKRTCSLRMVPPADLTETVRQKLKINKKQFLRCWEILIYLNLDSENQKSMDNFRACIYDRIKGEILGGATGTNGKRLVQIPSSFNEEESFAVYWTHEGGDADDQTVEQQSEDLKTQEQQLNELVDNQMEEIVEVAKNVTSRGKDKLSELAAL
ncbi:probable histone acetyltransferase type B catalytic subunit [Phragmites australis]|uniref:probable histone acetyltransferase type B catalytic subunit n=1 Tax=Phragmites australis TaxID=29695 RepID=UPI002D79B1A4|nr:probable histone acetyltransferase type B catalytic subunit [Phragmites australis]